MKKLSALFVIVALTISIFAQSPQRMSYQAVIRNSSDQLVANHTIGMRISILQGSATGTPIYIETQAPITNANGLVTIEIGGGTIVTGSLPGIDWSTGVYFIKTETDPTGGTNYTITGISQILSVPYALYAKTAKTADYNDLSNKPPLFDGTWTSLIGKPSFATVATSGSYDDLTNKPTLFNGTWISLTGKPTTIEGYGITNGMSTSHPASGITSTMIANWNTAFGWGNHAGLYRPITYVPIWSEIKNKPTTISGYGITDAVTTSGNQIITGTKTIIGTTTNMEEALFEVKNKDGQTIFAVYNEGVRIYVADGKKGAKGGFAVGGFGTAKTESQKYLYVDADSIRAYIYDDPAVKGAKGGFAVGGFNLSKTLTHDYLLLSPDSIRMYIDNTGIKGAKGGFAVGGFNLSKGTGNDYMLIKPDSTNFYVRELTPLISSSFNIIGTKLNKTRKSLMIARTDTVGISGVLNLQNNLFVNGNISVAGKINTTISDVDGNVYNTVIIGTQVWMAENLKTTRLNDGTAIPLVPDAGTWETLSTPGYCWYSNDEATYKLTYGALYNWYTANTGKLCPSGWHIPNNTDWTILTDYLGGVSVAGGKLKELGTTHWNTPNTAATDEVNFTGLPGGARGSTGIFDNLGKYGYWWAANAHSSDPSFAWGFVLSYISGEVIRADYYYKKNGFSVRCVKD